MGHRFHIVDPFFCRARKINTMTVVQEETKVLSKATPITIALALALCAGAFWGGRQSTHISTNTINIEANKQLIERVETTNNLTQQLLTKITQQNEYMEERLERLEIK